MLFEFIERVSEMKLTETQLQTAEDIIGKNEKKFDNCTIKNFILNKCYCIALCKEALLLLAPAEGKPSVREMLDEFVFDFSAPWLGVDCSYITKADYERIKNEVYVDPSLKESQKGFVSLISPYILKEWKD